MVIKNQIKVALFLVAIACGASLAGESLWAQFGTPPAGEYFTPDNTKLDPSPNGRSKHWSELVGKPVVVEGIAWTSFAKGEEEYVILRNAIVYTEPLNGRSFLNGQANGKLVRVCGVLKHVRIPAAAPGHQGRSVDIEFYRLENPTWTVVEQIESPWLEELRPQGK